MSELQIEVVQMTPEMAAAILADQAALGEELGFIQRKLDRGRIGQYAREMATGQWKLNGETIQFNGRKLLNGQHRLHAVVAQLRAVPLLIVRGVEEAAFTTIDQGKARTAGDVFAIMNLGYSENIARCARVALSYERYGYPLAPRMEDRVTVRESIDYTVQHGDALNEAVRLSSLVPVRAKRTLAPLFFLGRHRSTRDTFARGLQDGVNLDATNPIHVLRERLLAADAAPGRWHTYDLFALCVKAWNAHNRGEKIQRLRYDNREDYPVMVR